MAVREEREVTQRQNAAIEHKPAPAGVAPYVLNTAQMRSATHVQRFRVIPAALDADKVIQEGAEREIATRIAIAAAQAAKEKTAEHAVTAATERIIEQAQRPQRVQQLIAQG